MSAERKRWMSILARAPGASVTGLWAQQGRTPAFHWLRRPETGAVMARGRAGATGAPFNLGEVTVTRCALRLTSGETGHAYVQGTDPAKAEAAALIDALMQTDAAPALEAAIIAPLEREMAAAADMSARKAAATKVEFFTMVRGEG